MVAKLMVISPVINPMFIVYIEALYEIAISTGISLDWTIYVWDIANWTGAVIKQIDEVR